MKRALLLAGIFLAAPSRTERGEMAVAVARRQTLDADERFRRGLALMTEALETSPHGLGIAGWSTEDILGMAREWTPPPDGTLALWVEERVEETMREAREMEGV